MENLGQTLFWIWMLGCVLPFLVMTVLAAAGIWFGKRWLDDITTPDVEKVHAQYIALKEKHPDADQADLVRRIANRQALRCGIVGFITGFGGFVTLPITLPIDILLSAQIQATMISTIAQIYGYESSVENKAATYAIMSGSGELTKASLRVFTEYAPRFIGKSFSKLIPFFGALISFGVNYFITQSTARLAVQWYETKSKQEIMAASEQPQLA